MRLPRLAAAVVALLILGCGTSVRPGRSGAHKPARVAPLGPSVSRSPRRSTVVDPHQAARAVATLFRLREDALAREDIAGVRRVETGAAEERDVGLIEDARGIRERLLNTHRSLGAVQVLVPRQTTYPARALGVLEIRSPFPTAAGLYVATRAGPRAPWKLAVVVETIKSSLLLLVQRAVNRRSGYEVTGHKPWISPGAVYGLLASYMQYWKQHDSPPPQTPFAPGPATTGEGSASGATRQDAVSNQGVRQHISNFAAPRHDGAYLFPVTPTVSLICGAVRVLSRDYPAPGSSGLLQDARRQNWGGWLAPGVYASLSHYSIRQSCIGVGAKRSRLGVIDNSKLRVDAWPGVTSLHGHIGPPG